MFEITIRVSDEHGVAIEQEKATLNTRIQATNERIQAAMDLATAQGVPYSGPSLEQLLSVEDVAALWITARAGLSVRGRVQELMREAVTATGARRVEILQELTRFDRRPR